MHTYKKGTKGTEYGHNVEEGVRISPFRDFVNFFLWKVRNNLLFSEWREKAFSLVGSPYYLNGF